MTIQYASDLHLEFSENREFIKANPLKPIAEILVLAGDIIPYRQEARVREFFDYLSENWKYVYLIPGNHEYYGSNLFTFKDSGIYERVVRKNVSRVNHKFAEHGGVRIIFSTLWSRISPVNEFHIHEKLSDFREIRNGSDLMSVEDYNNLHEQSKRMIEIFLKIPFEGKTLVVTHHLPTLENYPEQYKNDPLNEIFATELSDLILEYQPDAWIFGHHHHNVPEFRIGNTRMLTNQLGRVENGKGLEGFSETKILEL